MPGLEPGICHTVAVTLGNVRIVSDPRLKAEEDDWGRSGIVGHSFGRLVLAGCVGKSVSFFATLLPGKLVRGLSTRVQGFHAASGICLVAGFSKATPS
jgi:hypothetical protein